MSDEETHEVKSSTKTIGETVKLAVSVLILVVLILFGVANSDEVRVDLVVTDADLPLIVVILGSAVAGALIAALLRRRRS